MAPQLPIPFLSIAGAIPVLVALTRDGRLAGVLAVIAATAAASVLLPLPVAVAHWMLVGIVAILFATCLLGQIWRTTGSVNLVAQVAVLGTMLTAAVPYLVLNDPAAIWVKPVTDEVARIAASRCDRRRYSRCRSSVGSGYGGARWPSRH